MVEVVVWADFCQYYVVILHQVHYIKLILHQVHYLPIPLRMFSIFENRLYERYLSLSIHLLATYWESNVGMMWILERDWRDWRDIGVIGRLDMAATDCGLWFSCPQLLLLHLSVTCLFWFHIQNWFYRVRLSNKRFEIKPVFCELDHALVPYFYRYCSLLLQWIWFSWL